MVGTHFTKDRDDGVSVLAGIDSPSSLRSAWAGNVISFPSLTAAADWFGEDAGELDEDVFPLGSLAVKLIGTFQFPRLLVMRQDQS
jgi:hypothetical protein